MNTDEKGPYLTALGKALPSVVEHVPGLRVVVISGGDGITLLKYPDDQASSENSGSIGSLESSFAIAVDQVLRAIP
jgi:hypothetical protein